ncbi:putative receptor-like protein kinase At4g00960 [Juglans microcarpa x Juglans regia]|uniref:putative receptor-like protein kinase At4g00960 n=1 Tax=Juglans microcarpa x Juglans regia TaxID=2249226 RepID=UPI001B7EC194|nr:putative receptor-like protein kinase At4g00960 [Juglans microcarpa x Juglans regia]
MARSFSEVMAASTIHEETHCGEGTYDWQQLRGEQTFTVTKDHDELDDDSCSPLLLTVTMGVRTKTCLVARNTVTLGEERAARNTVTATEKARGKRQEDHSCASYAVGGRWSPCKLTDTSVWASGTKRNSTTTRIVIVVVPTLVGIILVISIIYAFLRVRKRKDHFETMDEMGNEESLQFDFDVIRAATCEFSDANKVGKGGFGPVYEGKLPNGQEKAVKRLSRTSGQGNLEFTNEVVLVAKLQHRNLVRLLGFCLEGNERLLVYEFVPNSSLDRYIFDIEMNPKISDFGMARMCVLDQTEGSTNRIVGTYGYMAPEYAMLGRFSVKSDVFSFGVLMLELVSGQKITSFREGENIECLLSYAWKNWREGTAANLIDLTLRSAPLSEIIRCIHIGLLCVQANIADRLDMATVVLLLNSNSIALPLPTQPASSMQNGVPLATSMKLDTDCRPVSQYEVSITELDPR